MSGVAVRVSGIAFRVRVAMEACSSIRVGATLAQPGWRSFPVRRRRRRAAYAAAAGFPGWYGGHRTRERPSIPKASPEAELANHCMQQTNARRSSGR